MQEPVQTVYLGKACFHRASLFHTVYHYKYHLILLVHKFVATNVPSATTSSQVSNNMTEFRNSTIWKLLVRKLYNGFTTLLEIANRFHVNDKPVAFGYALKQIAFGETRIHLVDDSVEQIHQQQSTNYKPVAKYEQIQRVEPKYDDSPRADNTVNRKKVIVRKLPLVLSPKRTPKNLHPKMKPLELKPAGSSTTTSVSQQPSPPKHSAPLVLQPAPSLPLFVSPPSTATAPDISDDILDVNLL